VTFRKAGYFYIGVLVPTVVAFWPQYLAKLPAGGISGYLHFHSLVMTAWFGVLIAQPFLLRAGRRRVHRALGKLSYGLVPMIAVSIVLLAHSRLPPVSDPGFAEAAPDLYLALAGLLLFVLAYVLGVVHRRSQPLHARYMLCTGLALADPIVARLLGYYLVADDSWFERARLEQAVTYVVVLTILGALIVRERDQPRGRAAFPVMLGATTVVFGLWYVIVPGAAWLGFARWFAGLPLT